MLFYFLEKNLEQEKKSEIRNNSSFFVKYKFKCIQQGTILIKKLNFKRNSTFAFICF